MRTPNDLVYGELNKYPISLKFVKSTIRYWIVLTQMKADRLPRIAYNIVAGLLFSPIFVYSQIQPISKGEPNGTGRRGVISYHPALHQIEDLALCNFFVLKWSIRLANPPMRLLTPNNIDVDVHESQTELKLHKRKRMNKTNENCP